MAAAILDNQEILAVPEWVTSETLYEIIDGRYVEIEPMGVSAVWICAMICQHISEYARRKFGHAIPEMLLEFPGSTRRRRPDGIYVSYDRWSKGRELPNDVAWQIVPEMCLEVISPTDLFEEVKTKMSEYFAVGVSEVWIVSPAQKLLEIYTSMSQSRGYRSPDIVDCSTLIPGFQLNLGDIFDSTC